MPSTSICPINQEKPPDPEAVCFGCLDRREIGDAVDFDELMAVGAGKGGRAAKTVRHAIPALSIAVSVIYWYACLLAGEDRYQLVVDWMVMDKGDQLFVEVATTPCKQPHPWGFSALLMRSCHKAQEV